MLGMDFRFGRHGGHGRTHRWLDPVANGPAKEVNFCCRYRPSVEVAIEKLVQAVTCIVRRLAVVFHPVIKQGHAGLEVPVIESVVRAGIDNELDWRPVVAPAGDFIGAVCRRRPIVEGPNEDERGYPRTRHGLLTWRIERSRRPEPQVAWREERFERIGFRHGEGNPTACREADRSHTVWIDEGLASQEDESPVGIRPATEDGDKRA